MSNRDRKRQSDLWLPAEPWVIREGIHTPPEQWDMARCKDALAYFTACQRRIKDAIDQNNDRMAAIERAILRLERVQSDEAREQLSVLRQQNHGNGNGNGNGRWQRLAHDAVRAGLFFLPIWVLFGDQLTEMTRTFLEAIGWTF